MAFFKDLSLLRVAIREQRKAEMAYLGNFWFSMLSRLIYNTVFLVFIHVLFERIGSLAGYTKNDFFFMYFVSQLGFYTSYYVLFQGAQKLVLSVRTGNFDLLLLKPVPHRPYAYVAGLLPFEVIVTLVSMCGLIATQIDWAAVHIPIEALLLGSIIWLCGLVITNTLIFILALPAFKAGDATDSMNIFYSITSIAQMPYSQLPMFIKALSLFFLPQLIITGATTEVLLAKGNPWPIVIPIVIAAVFSVILYQFLWRYALRNYTSASS